MTHAIRALDRIAQIRAAHQSARPNPAVNPAWANAEHDIGVLLATITTLERQLATAREALEACASILPRYSMAGKTAGDDEELAAVLETVTEALSDGEAKP